ncbi:MAG: universal stress protein [Thermoleophilaceae bacterium]
MTDGTPTRLLVVANETVVGKPLIDAVRARAAKGPVQVHVICPQNMPRAGWVQYADEGRGAAENRLKATLARLNEAGIQADGELMDPDPYTAVMDALGQADYDEIIVSTHPETRSGWLRRDLVQRVKQATRRPVEHVVVEQGDTGDRAKETLVVANQTVETDQLFDALKRKAAEGPRRFVVILPQGEGGGGDPYERLAHVLQHLEEAGLDAVGQVVHPDPFTAIQNAVQFYPVDDIIISTFEPERSGWLRSDLVERVRSATGKPVEHIVAQGAPSLPAKEGQAA